MSANHPAIMRIAVDRQLRPVRLAYRWYRIPHAWMVTIWTDCGVIRIRVAAGFLFDGRSGGPLLDYVAPNLGTTAEVWAWAVHDLLGHGVYGDVQFANDALHWMLLHSAFYTPERAALIVGAVSAYTGWWGEPEIGEKSYHNLRLITVRHDAK